jgi:type II secretory pathway pseudopilin PulG
MKKTQLATNKGFSLMELLVSMALFIVVITIAVGALLVLINANLKAQNSHEAVSNVQFALDSMAREIRTGLAYFCSNGTETSGDFTVRQDCDQGSYLSFVEGGKSLSQGATNQRIAYRYNAGESSIERKIGVGSWIPLTNENVEITELHFNVANSASKENSNAFQPNVTIFISGMVAGLSGTDSAFNLQTTVTQRVLDL